LAKILGTTTIVTNSFHHQAVKDVAHGFTVTGRTADGVVESMEMTGNPRIFSVQFHPEAPTAHGLDEFLPVFTYLVGLAGGK
jgi:putative glutamine amidotransferase